MFTALHTADQA